MFRTPRTVVLLALVVPQAPSVGQLCDVTPHERLCGSRFQQGAKLTQACLASRACVDGCDLDSLAPSDIDDALECYHEHVMAGGLVLCNETACETPDS